MDFGLIPTSPFRVSTRREWESQLAWAIGANTLHCRDERLARLVETVRTLPSPGPVCCVVLEHVSVGSSGHPGSYESLVLFSLIGGAGSEGGRWREAMAGLSAVEVPPPHGRVLRRLVLSLLSQGPSDNGMKASGLDVFLVTLFDGHGWKQAQFSNFEDLMDERPPAASLPGTCLFYVLDFVNMALDGNTKFARQRHESYRQ
jgi:hypothetical protein